jgi:site-specific DNA recombinase
LRDAAWRGELDRVLILSPDRLARHYAYQYVVVEELERSGCAVVFVNGPFNSTPEERLVREVHGLFAEFERAAMVERSRRGKLHAARRGQFFTGAAPYGYTYLKATDAQPGRCVVNEVEAATVKQMFSWLIEEQLSTYAIAKRLTAQGVPTRHGAVPWSPASVHRILSNQLYTGTHYYNRTENAPEIADAAARRPKEPRRRLRPRDEWIAVPWTPLISEEMFTLASRQLQLNRERSPRKTRFQYLLQGLLVCAYCGRRLGGHAGVASGRYECTRRRSIVPPERRCQLRSVSQRDVEPLVWEHIAQLLRQPELIMDYLRQQQAGDGPELTDAQRELKRLQRQRAALAREEQRLIDAYQVGALELDELKERRLRLREAGRQVHEREQLVAKQLAQAQQAATLSETVTAFCQRIQAQLVESSFEVKQKLLRLVVERIVVSDDALVIQHIIPGDDTSRLYLRPNEAVVSSGTLRLVSGTLQALLP